MATLTAQLPAHALAPVAGDLSRSLAACLMHAHSRVRLAALRALDRLVLQVWAHHAQQVCTGCARLAHNRLSLALSVLESICTRPVQAEATMLGAVTLETLELSAISCHTSQSGWPQALLCVPGRGGGSSVRVGGPGCAGVGG